MQPFNKYYPPDWTPEKGSVNKFVGKHPLGDRARKIDQGILIVRFELPFNIWCEGCGNHVGKGVRYNAEKKKIGKYFSTPIFSFRMKCHLCDNWIEIHTDPKNAEYLVVSGARKKVETWEPEDSEVIKLKDDDEAKKMVDNALYKLEYSVKDELRSRETLPILTQLQRLNDKQWADPYTHSQRMRKKFREEKKELEAKKRADEEICDRNALSIPLLPESQEDIVKARTTEFSDKFAKLSAIVAVNTKLKIDPFLKDNDWNTGNNINGTEKGENNKDLVIIKKKESNHHQSEVLDSRNITPAPLRQVYL
ncbi:14346_t:CDS:10 [Rhizophagus irregularis]|nr:14346_t:CDS:10 [Rhizophagus irregularis]